MNKTTGIIIAIIVIALGAWMIAKNKSVTPVVAPTTQSDTSSAGNQPADTMGDNTGDMGNMGDTSNSGTTSVSTTTTITTGAVKSFTVTGSNFKFEPATLTVNKGDTVKITFKNSGGFHDFKIDEFNVATHQIQGGSEETVTFVADKTGPFIYYCSVMQHRAMGMWGTLTVK